MLLLFAVKYIDSIGVDLALERKSNRIDYTSLKCRTSIMQCYASCKRRDNSTSDADIGNALNLGFLEGIYPDPERVVLNFSLHFQFENIIQL